MLAKAFPINAVLASLVGVWGLRSVGLCMRGEGLRTGPGILDGQERCGLEGTRSNTFEVFATWAGACPFVLDLGLCRAVEDRRTIGSTVYATSSSEISFN
jgi:hypothetical protein